MLGESLFTQVERDLLRRVLRTELAHARGEADVARLYNDRNYLNEQLLTVGTIQDILDKIK